MLGTLGRRIPAPRAWAGALLFGTLAYLCITSFTPQSAEYGTQRILSQVFTAAATLMLLTLLAGMPKPDVALRTRWIVAAALLAMLASTFTAPRWPMALDRLQLYYGIALFGGAVYLWHRGREGAAAGPYLLAIGVVHALVLMDIVFWLLMVHGGDTTLAHRMPHHGNVRHFGYLGFLGASAGAALVLLSRRLAVTGIVLCAAALFGVIQLGSRGAFLAWIVFVGATLVLGKGRIRFMVGCVLALALALAAVYGLQAANLLSAESLMTRAQQGEMARISDRWALWFDVLKAIATHPWFGWGPDGHLASACCSGRGLYLPNTAQAHNVVLQLLEEFGVVGGVLLIALAFQLIRRWPNELGWWGLAHRQPEIRVLIAILTGYSAFGMVDGVFYYPVPLLHFAALSGLLFALAQNQPADQNRGL